MFNFLIFCLVGPIRGASCMFLIEPNGNRSTYIAGSLSRGRHVLLHERLNKLGKYSETYGKQTTHYNTLYIFYCFHLFSLGTKYNHVFHIVFSPHLSPNTYEIYGFISPIPAVTVFRRSYGRHVLGTLFSAMLLRSCSNTRVDRENCET